MPIELATDEQDDRIETLNSMVRINGKSFRCSCGANVFSKLVERGPNGEERYECHGCEAMYLAE